MGLALIIPNIDFSGANIGRVTPAEDVPLVSLSVSGPDSVTGGADAATYLPVYNPANTNQRSVAWSVQSGGTYATITTGGVLTILQGASASSVTIRVTSTINPSIYAEKTITVTYNSGHATPLYTFSKTYSSESSSVEDVSYSSVTTNNCILTVDFNITSHSSGAFFWTMNIGQSPWSGINIGWNRAGSQQNNEFYQRNGENYAVYTTLNTSGKIAIKIEPVSGQSYLNVSYTLDGTNWTTPVATVDIGSACSVGAGYKVAGSIAVNFYNTTDDISFFFD